MDPFQQSVPSQGAVDMRGMFYLEAPPKRPIVAPYEFYPAPPSPDVRDPAWRVLALNELEKVIIITAALTAIARWVPGPVGIAARFFAVAALGTSGENKAGEIGGAKSNILPAPLGFANPEVYGLKKNYWLPAGSTHAVPQFVDLLGLGLNEQRYEDMRADQKEDYDYMKGVKEGMAVWSDAQWKARDQPELLWPLKPMNMKWFFGNYRKTELRNIAIANERLYRALPRLRHSVNNRAWVPMEIITQEFAVQIIAADEAILAGSLQPELIEPTNAKAIENAERAKGIRRELVTERADP